jgi:hypothetical protein
VSNKEIETLRIAVADLEVDIRRLKKVIRRAAEALEEIHKMRLNVWSAKAHPGLIAELRKAAE